MIRTSKINYCKYIAEAVSDCFYNVLDQREGMIDFNELLIKYPKIRNDPKKVLSFSFNQENRRTVTGCALLDNAQALETVHFAGDNSFLVFSDRIWPYE